MTWAWWRTEKAAPAPKRKRNYTSNTAVMDRYVRLEDELNGLREDVAVLRDRLDALEAPAPVRE